MSWLQRAHNALAIILLLPRKPAGYPPIYRESALDAPEMAQFRRALDFILLANEGTDRFMGLWMDPEALRPYIVNWEATAAALIQWLHRDLLRSADPGLRLLLEELPDYPEVPRNWRMLDLDAPTALFLTIEMHKGEAHLRFFKTLTTRGTPYDIRLHELRIESFFPADEATDMALRRLRPAGLT